MLPLDVVTSAVTLEGVDAVEGAIGGQGGLDIGHGAEVREARRRDVDGIEEWEREGYEGCETFKTAHHGLMSGIMAATHCLHAAIL